MPAATLPNVKPSIKLVGPPKLSLDSGEPYERCSSTAKLSDICDKGVVATDEEDGESCAKNTPYATEENDLQRLARLHEHALYSCRQLTVWF